MYLLVHGAAAYLALSGDLGKVIHLLLFLKSGQYFCIYYFYRKFNAAGLVMYMNMGIRLRNLFAFIYSLDMLLLVITLTIIKL